jgi:hypothetical protein
MNLLDYLEKKTKLSGDVCISYDELAEWPVEQIEEAKQQGCLVQTDDAEGIICRQCPKGCWKDVEIRPKDDHNVGVYFCEDEDCAGLIEIELERLQQWQINKKKLTRLGYGVKKGKSERQISREQRRQNEKLQLQAALLKHHGFDSDTFNYTPANQKELQKLTHWNQTKVHRVMRVVFGDDPMRVYKQRCRQKTIVGFLKKNDNNQNDVEAIYNPDEQ